MASGIDKDELKDDEVLTAPRSWKKLKQGTFDSQRRSARLSAKVKTTPPSKNSEPPMKRGKRLSAELHKRDSEDEPPLKREKRSPRKKKDDNSEVANENPEAKKKKDDKELVIAENKTGVSKAPATRSQRKLHSKTETAAVTRGGKRETVPTKCPKRRVVDFEQLRENFVVVDTESKQYDNPLSTDPAFILVFEMSIIELTRNLGLHADCKVFNVLMNPGPSYVIQQKLPRRIPPWEWKDCKCSKDEALLRQIFHLLDGKIWVGWNVGCAEIGAIRALFKGTKVPPPQPRYVFDVMDWARTTKARSKVGDTTLKSFCKAFKMGKQIHRTEDDCIKCIRVMKYLIGHERLAIDQFLKVVEERLSYIDIRKK